MTADVATTIEGDRVELFDGGAESLELSADAETVVEVFDRRHGRDRTADVLVERPVPGVTVVRKAAGHFGTGGRRWRITYRTADPTPTE